MGSVCVHGVGGGAEWVGGKENKIDSSSIAGSQKYLNGFKYEVEVEARYLESIHRNLEIFRREQQQKPQDK